MRFENRIILGVFAIFVCWLFYQLNQIIHEKPPESLDFGATTEFINPNDIKYTILPILKQCEINNPEKKFLIIIHNRAESFHRRKQIRESFGQSWIKENWKFDIIFVLGKPQNLLIQKVVENEAKVYGDILQSTILDAYRNLTYKAVSWMKFLHEKCNKIEYILKIDDDVVPDFSVVGQIIDGYKEELK
uniref:Hexosyltransferase n=1 Tax=Panagrolaimus sp. JU765 TaxID=591449 RepID=A0AC34RE46_9BILA